MHGIRKTDVVVGIDGSDTSTAAALWAAGEANRRGVRLVLLYAYVLYAYGSKNSALPGSVPYEEAEIDADQLLATAADAVRRDHPTLTIETIQEHEPAATALLEITGAAALTVIASQAKHQAVETLMGSVATYTAEQSKGPVVVLRGDASSVSASGPVCGIGISRRLRLRGRAVPGGAAAGRPQLGQQPGAGFPPHVPPSYRS
jgi:nucleotide-binding universal stress UspA family protein